MKSNVNDRSTLLPILASIAAGVALFVLTAVFTNKREPWDSSLYWSASYPLAIVVSAVLGYRYPERSWRWPLWLFESQFIAMCIRNGELGNLWPMGMVMFGIIALPAILAAKTSSKYRLSSKQT